MPSARRSTMEAEGAAPVVHVVPPVVALPTVEVGCAAQAGRRERSGSRPSRDGRWPRRQRDRHSAPPPAARLDPLEPSSAAS
jgi:hypothetical protein